MSIAVLVKEWVLPNLIPIFAVFLGFRIIYNKKTNRETRNNEKIQRKKILMLLKKETEIFLQYQNEMDIFRSRKYMTLNLVVNNPIFNMEEHERLIELVFEIARIQDNIETSVFISSNIVSGTISNFLKPSLSVLFISIITFIENLLGKKEKTMDKVEMTMKRVVNNTVKKSSIPAKEVLNELLNEINRLIINHGYNN